MLDSRRAAASRDLLDHVSRLIKERKCDMLKPKLSIRQSLFGYVQKVFAGPKVARALTWTRAHDCVGALRHLVQKADLECSQAEEDHELSASGIARRRSEICNQALRKLVNFPAFEIAEKALIANIEALEWLNYRDPEQVEMLEMSKQALRDLREGISATRRMLEERCTARKRVFA